MLPGTGSRVGWWESRLAESWVPANSRQLRASLCTQFGVPGPDRLGVGSLVQILTPPSPAGEARCPLIWQSTYQARRCLAPRS